MTTIKHYAVLPTVIDHAVIKKEQYERLYAQARDNPEVFWGEQAKQWLNWDKPFESVLNGDFTSDNIEWFSGGALNVSSNCIDRHLEKYANKPALIWEGNDPTEQRQLTYKELHQAVCQFASVLKSEGIKPGDLIGIYMPMIPEVVIAMLAATRIGAVHSVIFGGFSSEALALRLNDAACRLVVTVDESPRADKCIPFKANVDKALLDCSMVKRVIVVKRTGARVAWDVKRDRYYHELMRDASAVCPPTPMASDAPLFILYTSGSTGKPKGILHTTGGYLLYVTMTFALIFDHQPTDKYWCTADVGWITGHSYGVYGPLSNGATVLLFEGVPNYPTYGRYWEVIDRHQISIFYTSPTALRSIRGAGGAFLDQTSRQSLRLLGSVGEPINPDVWEWYYHHIGLGRCPIVNTWWQTETGACLLSPLPGVTPLAPGSVGWPFLGVIPDVVDEDGRSVHANEKGLLVIKNPWPGMMKTIYGDKQRFIETYFQTIPGAYFTGDLAYYDEYGDFWILGRGDDVIKVSGHRLGTEELESALVSHHAVSEAAVVGFPHEIKGEGLYAFVTLKSDHSPSDALKKELIAHVREKIGPVATLDTIQWADALPKTRSGKIMRRILKKIVDKAGYEDLGDLSTLADSSMIDNLIEGASVLE